MRSESGSGGSQRASAARGRSSAPRRVDAIDKGIIEALQANGREPFRRIAATLGVSEATIRARYARLVRGRDPAGDRGHEPARPRLRGAGDGRRAHGRGARAVADEIAQLGRGRRTSSSSPGQFDVLVELVCGRPARVCSTPRTGSARLADVIIDRELPLPRAVEAALRLGCPRARASRPRPAVVTERAR